MVKEHVAASLEGSSSRPSSADANHRTGISSAGNFVEAQPTVGVDLEQVQFRKLSITFREVGGSFILLWHTYLASAKCVLFVIDTSDACSFATATVELHELVKKTAGKVAIMLYFNRIDSPAAVPMHVMLSDVLVVSALPCDAPWQSFVSTGMSAEDVLAWISKLSS
jgi:hypothetical protein